MGCSHIFCSCESESRRPRRLCETEKQRISEKAAYNAEESFRKTQLYLRDQASHASRVKRRISQRSCFNKVARRRFQFVSLFREDIVTVDHISRC